MSKIGEFTTRSEEFFPLNWLDKMLDENPIYFEEEENIVHAFKYKDVQMVLKNYEYFSSRVPSTGQIMLPVKKKEGSLSVFSINEADPPQHRKIRSVFSTAFTPKSLKDWKPRIEQIAKDLVNSMPEEGEVDLVDKLALPMPSTVITDLFGVPLEDQEKFRNWIYIMFLPYKGQDKEKLEKEKKQVMNDYFEYVYPIVMSKRENPQDDIISDLTTAEIEGERLTDDEIVGITMALLGAGVETTSHMLSLLFYSMLYDDDTIYTQLSEDESLVPNTIEEMLRYRFHLSSRDRIVAKDNDLLGVKVKKGQIVKAWMSAANMDKDIFEDPFKLDIQRSNSNRHISFGNGPHFCLGAPLARLELDHALRAMLAKYKNIQPVESFNLEENLTNSIVGQTLTSLPVKLIK